MIRRDADGELTGRLEELAMMPFIKFLPKKSMDEKILNFIEIQKLNAILGITISQDGMTMPDQFGATETGKLADLVILDKNPLTVVPDEIKEIKVVETIKEGHTIYQNTSPETVSYI